MMGRESVDRPQAPLQITFQNVLHFNNSAMFLTLAEGNLISSYHHMILQWYNVVLVVVVFF